MHPIEYILLTGYAGISFLLFLFLDNPQAKLILLYGAIVYYLVWALAHHAFTKTLSKKIVLEYLFIALIAMLVLQVVFTTS